MDMEQKNARYKLAELIDSGISMKTIARQLSMSKSDLDGFYRGTGQGLTPAEISRLDNVV